MEQLPDPTELLRALAQTIWGRRHQGRWEVIDIFVRRGLAVEKPDGTLKLTELGKQVLGKEE